MEEKNRDAAPTLEYAAPEIRQDAKAVHPPVIFLFIVLTALAGVWSTVLGLTCVGDLWEVGLLLIASGVCLCWGAVGKLSASNLRPGAAIALLLPGVAISVLAAAISHSAFERQQRAYARALQVDRSEFRHLPTETERQVFTFVMLRDDAIASAGLGAICIGYAAWRGRRRRHAAAPSRST